MKNKQPSINLLKKDKGSFLDKFINWALTFGRLVVIVTEAVALGAFLYRFSLDRQLIDLHDEISQKQAIVKYLKTNEDKYRDTQARIGVAAKFIDSGQNTYNTLANVVNLAPENFTFNNLSVSENAVIVVADVQSLSSLTEFIDGLKNNPEISSVSLDQIQNKTSNGMLSVAISAKRTSKKPLGVNSKTN